MRLIMRAELGDGHHVVYHAAVLGAVNALRWRFDRVPRGLRALTAPARRATRAAT